MYNNWFKDIPFVKYFCLETVSAIEAPDTLQFFLSLIQFLVILCVPTVETQFMPYSHMPQFNIIHERMEKIYIYNITVCVCVCVYGVG